MIQRMNRKIIFLLIIIIVNIALSANTTIGIIEISGLKRTKVSVVNSLLKVKEGDNLDSFNEDEFKQDIFKTGIFSDVEIVYKENNDSVDLFIDISEKWTLIPIPFVSMNDEKTEGGIGIYESNFLGLQKTFGFGLIYSSLNEIEIQLAYIDGTLFNENNGGVAQVIINKDEFDEFNIDSIIGINNTSIKDITLELLLSYIYFGSSDSLLIGSIAFVMDKQRYSNTLNSGGLYIINYASGLDINNASYVHDLYIYTKYTFNPLRTLYLSGEVRGSLFDKPVLLEQSLGQKEGSTTISITKIDEYLAGMIKLENIFLDYSWGAITGKGYFESGIYNNNSAPYEYYMGPGLGVRVYLKGISLPALGIDCGYNLVNKEPKISAQIGISL